MTPSAQPSPTSAAGSPSRAGQIYSIELAVGGLCTLIILFFHCLFITHAGGLWRDEANTVGLATLPTFGEVWQHLEFDSFPLVWPLVVRFLNAVGLASDPAFRGLGLLMGVGVIAALWFVARTFRTGPPLCSLAIFALCPSVIIWGDCLRAHGCGIATSLFSAAFFWRFAETGERRAGIVATLAALLAVQTSYYNSIVVLAAGLGGFAVCLRRRRFRTGYLTLAAGVPAALSILPYYPVFRRAADWNILIQIPEYDFSVFWQKLSEALADAGNGTPWLWVFLLGVALALSVAALVSLPDWKVPPRAQDVILFNLIVLGVGILAFYGFLKTLHYVTQRWYYLPLLGFTAAGIDAILGAACFAIPARIIRIAVCLILFGVLAPGAWRAIPLRLTNVDLIAAQIKDFAGEKDLVVVDPWFCGITYARYNVASTPWSTLPSMDFHLFHRYDLIKQMMQDPDQENPVRPLLQRMRETLRANGKIYMVGGLRLPAPNTRPFLLPPAPQSDGGWSSDLYRGAWSLQVGYFLQLHAAGARVLEPVTTTPVNRFEYLNVVVLQGWKD